MIGHDAAEFDEHDDHGGLQRDLPVLLDRRHALIWMGGASLAVLLAACGFGGDGAESTVTTTPAEAGTTTPSTATEPPRATTGAPGTTTVAATEAPVETSTTALSELIGPEIPDETAGPFPADGTNGPNVLVDEGPFKPDITTSFAGLSGTAAGIPTTLQLTVVDNDNGRPLPGSVVYLWHCTADGRYSIYEVADQNYLRGIQVADDAGRLSFQTIFPGCYPGRWPHCHFEVFESLEVATAGSAAIKTSQLAFPRADCEVVYADDRYGNSVQSLSRLSLDSDGVFRDGWSEQLATVAGSVERGFTASLLVRV